MTHNAETNHIADCPTVAGGAAAETLQKLAEAPPLTTELTQNLKLVVPARTRRGARAFHEVAPAIHEDTYVPFLPAATLAQLRGLCANAAKAAATHLRDEAVGRIVARSAALPADRVPALAAVRDTSPLATADEAVVAALDPELHRPIDVEHVLAATARHTPVVVWPHSSPMAGAVRRALQYEAWRSAGAARCPWALVPAPRVDVDDASAPTPTARLERLLNGYGVVALRHDAEIAPGEHQFPVPTIAGHEDAAAAADASTRLLRLLLASWYDEVTGTFGIPAPPANARDTAVRTLAIAAPRGRDDCDTVFFGDVPDELSVRHVVVTACDRVFHPDDPMSADHSASALSVHERSSLPPAEGFDDGAFSECPKLVTLDLSARKSQRTVRSQAFTWCRSLERVFWPPGLEALGDEVLANCPNIEIVDLSVCASLRRIGDDSFCRCTSLQRVLWPSGLEMLGRRVFAACPKMVSVDLSACLSLRVVGDYAFSNCTTLRTAVFPRNVEELGDFVFTNCPDLKTVDLSVCTSLRHIGNKAFSKCPALERVLLPPGFPAPDVSAYYRRAPSSGQ
eukprot:CAMPEP_0174838842 /NCGR_PEP_ID=MMETSP1114-20130205/7661_1 /TAXON_ID=312471 /ORGANISM="Neobodo designis, Strain CCAP 1951/1" /LENGTH=567 /DNA_ID=CAMNT_0016072953 /DNA_START=73 /DNA_END=1776 /DNA_ORIENTATION=-